jgi:hypothetical protein
LKQTVRTRPVNVYRGINECKMGYQPGTNWVKDEKSNPLAKSHNILNTQKNYFSQLLNVHGVSNVRLMKVHTAKV